MPDGHPDLQGTYDLATMTPMERMPGDPPVLTKEQAEKLQKAEMARRTADGGKLDPNRATLPVGGDKSQGKSYFEILEKAGGGAVGRLRSSMAEPGHGLHHGRRADSNIHRHRSAGRPRATLQCRREKAARECTWAADVGHGREPGCQCGDAPRRIR